MAVTANQQIVKQGSNYKRKSLPCAASKHIYEGTHVYVDAAGRATDVIVDATTVYAGVATQEVDNSSGAAGDLNVEVFADGDFQVTCPTITLANTGAPIYGVDNYTLHLTATGRPRVGTLTRFVSSTVGIVTIRGLGET